MSEIFENLLALQEEKNQQQKNTIILCKVIGKFIRGKKEFLRVDAGMKTEGIVNAREFDKEPSIGDSVELAVVENQGNELLMSFKKVKFENVLSQMRQFQKTKEKVLVSIKEKSANGYKVNYEGVYGVLNSSANLKDKVEVYIVKVFKDGFYCSQENRKPVKHIIKMNVVDCQITAKDSHFAYLKISDQEKLEGIIDVKEIKSNRDIKAQIVYIEGKKAILSVNPIKKLEMKKILQNLDIEHDNFLKVSGELLSFDKQFAQVKIGKINCKVPVKDLFWAFSPYDPKIDVSLLKEGEKMVFHVKDIILYWKSDTVRVSAESQYQISSLMEGFVGEISDETMKVDGNVFDIYSKNKSGSHEFALETVQLKIKTASLNPYIEFEKNHPEKSEVTGTIITDPTGRREVFVDVDGVSCQITMFEVDWDLSNARKQFFSFKVGEKIKATVKHVNIEKSCVFLTLKAHRGDNFYNALRSLEKNKVYACKVEEIMLNQFKKTRKIKISLEGEKYKDIFGFVNKEDISIQKRTNVGDIIPLKFLKMHNQELLFSQKAIEKDENDKVAKMIEKINENEGDAFSSLEDHFNLF